MDLDRRPVLALPLQLEGFRREVQHGDDHEEPDERDRLLDGPAQELQAPVVDTRAEDARRTRIAAGEVRLRGDLQQAEDDVLQPVDHLAPRATSASRTARRSSLTWRKAATTSS